MSTLAEPLLDGLYRDGFEHRRGAEVLRGNAAVLAGVERMTFSSPDKPRSSDNEPAPLPDAMDTMASIREQAALLALQGAQAAAVAELEAARRQARTAALQEMEQGLEARLSEVRTAVIQACEDFRLEKESYFHAVEAEVVKLSLAIARRVLEREVRIDPTLLRGVVRVALERVAEESTAALHVPAMDEEAWRSEIDRRGIPAVRLKVDEAMAPGECLLVAEAGRVNLGVPAQLEEIERGFFDLLEQRPVYGGRPRGSRTEAEKR